MRVTVQVIMNKFSCAREVYKIAIIRWRIGGGGGGPGAQVRLFSVAAALSFFSECPGIMVSNLRCVFGSDFDLVAPNDRTDSKKKTNFESGTAAAESKQYQRGVACMWLLAIARTPWLCIHSEPR